MCQVSRWWQKIRDCRCDNHLTCDELVSTRWIVIHKMIVAGIFRRNTSRTHIKSPHWHNKGSEQNKSPFNINYPSMPQKSKNALTAMTAGCIAGAVEATAVWPMEFIKVGLHFFKLRGFQFSIGSKRNLTVFPLYLFRRDFNCSPMPKVQSFPTVE